MRYVVFFSMWRKYYGETDVNLKKLHADFSVPREASLLYPIWGCRAKKEEEQGKILPCSSSFAVAGTRLELVTFGL